MSSSRCRTAGAIFARRRLVAAATRRRHASVHRSSLAMAASAQSHLRAWASDGTVPRWSSASTVATLHPSAAPAIPAVRAFSGVSTRGVTTEEAPLVLTALEGHRDSKHNSSGSSNNSRSSAGMMALLVATAVALLGRLVGARSDNDDTEDDDDNNNNNHHRSTITATSSINNATGKLRRFPPSPLLVATSASAATATAAGTTTGVATSTSAASTPTAAATVPPQHQHSVSFRPRWFTTTKDDGSGLGSNKKSDEALWSGAATGKPYDVSVRAIRGGRFTMEDEYFVADGGRFAAVFDGHGGSGVSQYLKRQLYPSLRHFLHLKHWEESDDDEIDNNAVGGWDDDEGGAGGAVTPTSNDPSVPSSPQALLLHRRLSHRRSHRPSLSCHVAALRAAFEQVEHDVLHDDNLEFQGSTAVAVVVYESDEGHRTLLSANVGDSRAVLSRNGRAVELTRDHKPNDEKEKARIMALGETIEWDQDCKVHRVRNLSLARAIGDRYAKPAVSPEVEIQHFPVSEDQDEFVVIASDGLWDVMSSQDAVTFVHRHLQKELQNASPENADNYRLVLRRNMAKFLAREAIRKGSSDNVSVLLVWL